MPLTVLARARTLNRRIYASFPWGFRVANLLLKVASSYIETVGRVVLAEFIKAGVTGLPEIAGSPAAAFVEKVQGPRGPDRLPKGVGLEFGKKIYATLMAKSRSVDVTEEALSRLMLNIARGKVTVRPGVPVHEAEAFMMHAAKNLLIDIYREKASRPRGDSMTMDDEDEGAMIDLADPNSFRHLDEMIPRSEMANLMRDLEKIHPKAPSWFEAQLEGLTGRELAEEWGVSPPRVHQLEQTFLPKVKQVLREYIQAAA
jgi:RNA polymerase sigma factor (sigma-70 family)